MSQILPNDMFHVLMTAYNNEKFIEAALRPLLASPRVGRIVVVEGAWSPNAENQRSEDATLEILHELEHKHDKLSVFYWEQQNPDSYGFFQCDKHIEIVKTNALKHPYYDPASFQQQLMARDFGMRMILGQLRDEWETPTDLPFDANTNGGWLWIVDSDEVYTPEGIESLGEFIEIVGPDHDFFTIQGKNFFFNGKKYRNEWYRRLFKLKRKCFFSDDNSLEIPGEFYTRTMNIPPEIVEFFHYGYVGEFKVRKKLEMWRQDSVEKWMDKHEEMLKGRQKYDGSGVHLFGDLNPGYSNYTLFDFTGKHPEDVSVVCDSCLGNGKCPDCFGPFNSGGRCGCKGICGDCGGVGRFI